MVKRTTFIIMIVTIFVLIQIGACTYHDDVKIKFNNHKVDGNPSLSEILNKSGPHSFSYINAHGRRIAAADELGIMYYYYYDKNGRLVSIRDSTGDIIWRAN